LIAPEGDPLAEFLCPGHPLLDATLDLVLERYRSLLKQGAVLVDDEILGETPRSSSPSRRGSRTPGRTPRGSAA